jgi:hypothetical protein
MDHLQEAYSLVNQFHVILMNENTECGNEILCTIIAKQCAMVAVNFMLSKSKDADIEYWHNVKKEIILI